MRIHVICKHVRETSEFVDCCCAFLDIPRAIEHVNLLNNDPLETEYLYCISSVNLV